MNANQGRWIQKLFFDMIRQRLPDHISVVHEISEILEISYDSAYRRLRGDKNLTIEELKVLSQKFGISIDSLYGHKTSDILFQPFTLNTHADGFAEWLELRLLEVRKINMAREKEVIMVARDLPIYYYFNFPELVAFKLFFWKKILFHHPDYHNKQFDPTELPSEIMDVGQHLLLLYNRIPTNEIWCVETFTRILQQIEFCRISGFFRNKDDPDMLFEKIELLFRHIHYQTGQGCKFSYENIAVSEDENFKVFINEVLLMDNTVFVKREDSKTVFMTHNSLDILITTNHVFCKQVEQWLHTIMKTGFLISGTSALECNRFFNVIYEKLEEYKKETHANRYMM